MNIRMHIRPLYRELAQLLDAATHCKKPDANDSQNLWGQRHTARALALVKAFMPSGSGIDNGTTLGTTLDMDTSHGECLVFTSSFHKMDENGFYDGWADFSVIVKPSLVHTLDIELRFADEDDDENLGDYLHEVFHHALTQEINITEFYRVEDL